ncbi:MAG: basic amino acid ABC transporter substrate-binding protein [Truepera sp.]|nr:basic amino acid ABC transporter substrate-binding protein [Truepera sp.]
MKQLLALLFALSLSLGAAYDLGGRVLVVGTDATYPPFQSVDETGAIVGFDIDLVNAVCERINCVAQFKNTLWDGIFAALEAGDFDMVASGVSITEARQQVFDFSDPYHIVTQAIAVRVEDEGLTLEDFKIGYFLLGSQTGTTNAQLAEELFGRDRVRLYDTFGAAMLALVNGDVDGVVIDNTAAEAFVQQYAGQVAITVTGVFGDDPLGFVFRQGDELVDAINAGLAMVKADGTLATLVGKWFAAE